MAEGSLRDALSLLEQARAYCGDTIPDKEVRELLGVVPDDALEELVGAIASASADRALSLVHTFQKEGRNLQHFCREAIRHMRNLLIARACGADSDLIAATPDQRPALARAAEQFSEEDLTRFFQILLQTDDDLRRKPDPRVHLEMGLLRLINASRLAPLEELLADLRDGVPAASAGAGASRGTSPTPIAPRRDAAVAAPVSFTPAPQRVSPTSVAPMPLRTEPKLQVESPAVVPMTLTSPKPMATPAAQEPSPAPPSAPAAVRASGLTSEQVVEIKTTIQAQQKFLGELVENSSRWELEGSELRIYFSSKEAWCAEMLEGRDSIEKVRAASSKVLGRAVRVCAKLEAVAAAAASASGAGSGAQDLRAQFERDPMVRSMLQRFGGKITEVKHRPGES
jgi:DNA polymerase III gamma/tau subunit